MKVAFCTIVARNYLARALVLVESIARFHPDADCVIALVDQRPSDQWPGIAPSGVELLGAEAFVGEELFAEMALRYDVLELSTAIKPWLLSYLLGRAYDAAIYLDPDIVLFRRLDEVLEAHEHAAITLTPHLIDPIEPDGRHPGEETMLVAGTFNLGFVGVGLRAAAFLAWWSGHLVRSCLVAPERGVFVDQRWVNLAPAMFDAAILRSRALNVAYWNVAQRPLDEHDFTRLADGDPIGFFHFSGFDPRNPEVLSKHQDRITVEPNSSLAHLLAWYASALFRSGEEHFSQLGYALDVTVDGMRLDRIARRAIDEASTGSGTAAARAAALLDEEIGPVEGGFFRNTRYVRRIWETRSDLRVAFPNYAGRDARAFAEWLRVCGMQEHAPTLTASALGQRVFGEGVHFVGFPLAESGLGIVGRRLLDALVMAAQPFAWTDFSDRLAASTRATGVALPPATVTPEGCDIELYCMNPPQLGGTVHHIAAGVGGRRYRIGMLWWEMPTVPGGWRSNTELLDEIWSGSTFVCEALAPSSGVPVLRIPPCVQVTPADELLAAELRRELGLGGGEFVCSFVFDYYSVYERKNPAAVITAFRRAFGDRSSVRLILKTANERVDPEHAALLRSLAAEDARIRVVDANWSLAKVHELLRLTDAYVSLHRSEGFGLTIAEAMLLGKAVIATGWSGNTDYLDAGSGRPIGFTLEANTSAHGAYPAGSHWAAPDVDEAARCLRELFADERLRQALGRRARDTIATRYSVLATAAAVARRLAAIRALAARGGQPAPLLSRSINS